MIQDNFLNQHVPEAVRKNNILGLVFSNRDFNNDFGNWRNIKKQRTDCDQI